MKKYIALLTLAIGGISIQAQVAIGKEQVDGAGLLDFALGENKGILLPVVSKLPSQPANGTFFFNNVSTDTHYLEVVVYENNQWKALSNAGSLTVISENGTLLTTPFVENLSEEIGDGVVFGDIANSENIPEGVLVLEAEDKALILPKVFDPHLNMKSPRAGTIVYDLTTKSMVIFDGKVWNYWQ